MSRSGRHLGREPATGSAAPGGRGRCGGLRGGAGGAGPVLGGCASRDPPRGRPEGQDLLDRWLGRPLTAALLWPVLRPLRAFCPRLASLSSSADARVRAVLTYPFARLYSVPTEASLRILVSHAVSSR